MLIKVFNALETSLTLLKRLLRSYNVFNAHKTSLTHRPNISKCHNRWRNSRSKRRVNDFEREIDCPANRCSLMRCTVGPLMKDDSVVFKIRSRLFTQTQIENYAKSVTISSKLVARITRLPYQANPFNIEYQASISSRSLKNNCWLINSLNKTDTGSRIDS